MWKVLATVFSLLGISIAFGAFYVLTGNEAVLVVAAGAGGALSSYLGRMNGSGN